MRENHHSGWHLTKLIAYDAWSMSEHVKVRFYEVVKNYGLADLTDCRTGARRRRLWLVLSGWVS